MPRIETGPGTTLAQQAGKQVVERLLKELLGIGGFGGPIIFESPMAHGSCLTRVLVVWEAWSGIPPRDRADMIAEAYREFANILADSLLRIDPSAGIPIQIPRVSAATAIGVTAKEAIEQGFLPFKIVPSAENSLETRIRLRNEMRCFGLIADESVLELLLPTKELQEQAFHALSQKFPDLKFSKSETVTEDEF